MAFIPLGHECKLKGKAAIDGVGSRFGKSGGSMIHQGLLMIFGTVSMSAPYVAVILMARHCRVDDCRPFSRQAICLISWTTKGAKKSERHTMFPCLKRN